MLQRVTGFSLADVSHWLSLSPRPAAYAMDEMPDWGYCYPMEFDWRGTMILCKLREGCTMREAASAVGITRQALLKRMNVSPEFKEAVSLARETGREERTYRIWLRHPFRGKRPPTGKGNGGKPRFSYGRR